ncbi:MAG: hypothetical protein IPP35_02150 [Elusimicrobia bacterium]|nr:hypothetical protein [Elusimicrobiota bacterium]
MYSSRMNPLPPPSRLVSEKLGLPAGRSRGFHVVWGPHGVSQWVLEALCPLLEGAAKVYWVDAANRFDAHGFAKAAQVLGLDPRATLSRVHLARTFNAFQLAALVAGKLPRLPVAPVVLADPLAPFYDADLALEDARRAFDRLRFGLADVPGPVLVLLVDRPAPPDRGFFSALLLDQAQTVTRISGTATALAEVPRGSGPPPSVGISATGRISGTGLPVLEN